MFRFAPYMLKSLWRHRARTLLTTAGAAIGLFVFCFVGSLQQGLARLTDNERFAHTLVVFQENRFCPMSSRLPEDYARRIRQVAGVAEVVPIQVWTNNCRASLDAVVFHGLPAEQLRAARSLELLQGNWAGFEARHGAALVGRNVALRRGLQVGEQFSLGDLSVQVAGIFASHEPAEENLVYTHLKFLQYRRGNDLAGLVTQHEVWLTDGADAYRVAGAIDAMLRSGPVATTTRPKAAFQASTLSDLVDLIGFAHWLGYACVALVLSLVAATTVMAVQDRIREHAVLQTIGLRPMQLFALVIGESVLPALFGGTIGTLAILALLASLGLAIGAEGVLIPFEPSLALAAWGIAVSLGVGVAAGVFPAWQAARSPIVEALKAPA